VGPLSFRLIRMDLDSNCRFRLFVMFFVVSIFPMTAIVAAASTARKNTAGSREQGDNAY
jgi:hypothetical protein